MRYCIFCGIEIPKDALYCQICGKKQPEDTVGSAEEEPAPKGLAAWLSSPKNMLLAGGGIFVLLLIIITAVMLLVL